MIKFYENKYHIFISVHVHFFIKVGSTAVLLRLFLSSSCSCDSSLHSAVATYPKITPWILSLIGSLIKQSRENKQTPNPGLFQLLDSSSTPLSIVFIAISPSAPDCISSYPF